MENIKLSMKKGDNKLQVYKEFRFSIFYTMINLLTKNYAKAQANYNNWLEFKSNLERMQSTRD